MQPLSVRGEVFFEGHQHIIVHGLGLVSLSDPKAEYPLRPATGLDDVAALASGPTLKRVRDSGCGFSADAERS